MTFQQQVKHALAVLAVISVVGSAPLAWAASGLIQSIQLTPDRQALLFRSNGPVSASMNTMRVGENQRIILDLRNAEIGSDLPRDPLLLRELTSQLPGIRNISLNQFGGAQPIVRVLLDLDGGMPMPQLTRSSGNAIELKLAGSVPTYPQEVRSSAVSLPGAPVASGGVDAGSYQSALRTVEEQRVLLQKLQTELFQLKSQLAPLPPSADSPHLQQEAERLRSANQSLQNQLFSLYEQQKQFKEKEAQLQASLAQAKKTQEELTWLKAENERLTSQASAKPVSQTELVQLKNELNEARTALSKSVTTINTQNKEIAGLKTRINDLQLGLDSSAKDQLTTLNELLITKESALEKRNTEVSQLKKELGTLKSQPAVATQADVDNLRSQLQEMTRQYQAAVAESNRQQQSSSDKLNEHSQLKTSNESLSRQVQALQEELRKANVRNQEALANYNRLQTDQAKASGLAEKDVKISKLEKDLAALQAKHEKALTEAEKLTLTLNAQNRELRDKLTATAPEVEKATALEKQSQDLQLRLSKAEKEVIRLQEETGKAAGQTEKLTRLEQEKTTLSNQVEALKALQQKATADQAALSGMKAQLDKLTAENQTLSTQVQSGKAEQTAMQELKAKLDKLTAENQALSAQVQSGKAEQVAAQDLKAQVDKLTAENKTLAAQVQSGKSEQASAQTLKAELDKQTAEVQNQAKALASLRQEKQTLSDSLAKLQASAATNPTAAKNTKDQAEQIAKLKQENASLLAALQKKPESAKPPVDEMVVLQKRFEDKEAELADAKSQLAALSKELTLGLAKKPEVAPSTVAPREDKKQAALQAENAQLKKEAERLRRELATAKAAKPTASPSAAMAGEHPEAEKHYRLGRDFESNGQPELALQEYQRALTLAPGNPEYVFRYSLELADQKKFEEAISNLQAYVSQHPQDREAFNQIGKVYLLNNQPDEAKKAFRIAMPPSVLNNYATVLKKQGKTEEAERFFRLALELNPQDSDILFNLGNLYNTANSLNQAKESYEQAIGLRPDFAEAHYNLGLIYSKMGDRTNAVSHLERYLQLSPNAGNAEAIRAYLQKLKGAA